MTHKKRSPWPNKTLWPTFTGPLWFNAQKQSMNHLTYIHLYSIHYPWGVIQYCSGHTLVNIESDKFLLIKCLIRIWEWYSTIGALFVPYMLSICYKDTEYLIRKFWDILMHFLLWIPFQKKHNVCRGKFIRTRASMDCQKHSTFVKDQIGNCLPGT